MSVWKSGDVWSTAGAWTVSSTLGASFEVRLSVVTKSGDIIPIIGQNGKEVSAQPIGEIDLGWDCGRKRLLEQRKHFNSDFNEGSCTQQANPQEPVTLGEYRKGVSYPQITGNGINPDSAG